MYLKKTLEEWARQTGFIKRKRAISAIDFLVLMTFGQAGMIHPSLAGMAEAIQAKVSRIALHQRFTKTAVAFMEKCIQFLLKQKMVLAAPIRTKLLEPFRRVLIFDSTSWDISPKLREVLPGSGGSASTANCKVQACYEYKYGELSFFDLTPGNKPDNAYTSTLPDHLQENDLILNDLGYFRLKTLKAIIQKGAFFLSRFLIGTNLYHAETKTPIVLEKLLARVCTDLFEIPVCVGDGCREVLCRLTCFRVSEETANERRRRLRKEAKKKGRTPSQRHLILADWIIMVTNVPQEWLPAKMVRALYSLRWQIELLFKQIKSVLRIHHSNTGNESRLRCEVYGKLIVAILTHRIHATANATIWNESRKELSFDKLYKRIQERAFHIADYLRTSFQHACNYLNAEIPRLIRSCIKQHQKSRKSTLQIIDEGGMPINKQHTLT